jgi:hypothetical protein
LLCFLWRCRNPFFNYFNHFQIFVHFFQKNSLTLLSTNTVSLSVCLILFPFYFSKKKKLTVIFQIFSNC